MKKYFFMVINIILYLVIYMAMQFVVSYGFIFFFKLKTELQGLNRVSFEQSILELLNENTSKIILLAIILSLIIYSIVLAVRRRTILDECSFKLIGIKQLSTILLAGAGLSMVIDGILTLLPVEQWFPSHQEVVNSITSGSSFTLTILTVGIVVPVFEEILLRGLVFNELRKSMNLTLAIILQALIFGVYHMNMLQAIYASILGLFLGLVYVWTKSIYAPILIHIFFNSSSLILSKLAPSVNIIVYMTLGVILFWIGVKILYKLTHMKVENVNLV